jgi:hypothetical protein
MPLTDYHKLIRDAVASTLDAAFTVKVKALDDLDDILRVESFPVIGVACVGPEQERPAFSTNERDGIGYMILVGLFTVGVANGEQSPDVPVMTNFRRHVRTLFHNKRLTGVAEVGMCEVSDSGPVFDKKDPALQRLSTALVVTAIGRFPRS